MERIGLFEARTRFSELITRIIRRGRGVTITRRGKPVVDITPSKGDTHRSVTPELAIGELEQLRSEIAQMSDKAIVSLIAEGRTRA